MLLPLLILCFLSAGNYFIYKITTYKQVHFKAGDVKKYHHLLILGAGKKNTVFYSRMNAALNLYKRNTINRIVCSGLTGIINYSEPYDMRDYLLSKGIPDSILILDIAGQHTFNSVCNYARNYKNDSVIIVSQPLHLNRALFIANRKGLNAAGFAASNYGAYNEEWRMYEFLSRIKCSFNLTFSY